MLILLVQNEVSNHSEAKDLFAVVKSKIPNASIDLISYQEVLGMVLDISDPVLVLIQDYSWAANLTKRGFEVIVWRGFPDLSNKLDMYCQLQRYKIQYPLYLKKWKLKEVLHNSDDAIVYRATNSKGEQVAIKQFKFLPSMITKRNIEHALKNIGKQCGKKSKGLVKNDHQH